jgi:spore coat protein CotF
MKGATFMTDIKNIPLISTEIAGLWKSYMSDSMITSVLKYFLNQVNCEQTRGILQQTYDLSSQHIQELTNIFNEENLPVPHGFTDSDVNANAPRLFTDAFYLQYLGYMARVSMHNYTLMLNQMARSDIRSYFSKRIYEYIDLYNNSADIKLSNGTFIRAPRIEVSKEIQYVKSQSFLLDWFGDKRPMVAGELTYVFAIIFSNIVGRAITTGFGQVSKEKKNSKYFFQGKDISSSQISDLTSLLTDEGIPIPSTSDSYVTDSTVSPFSEKLMLNHSMIMSSSGISNLGMAVSDTMRSDLQTKYLKFISEDMKYSKDGVDIMIANGWLEQPPQVVRHENLVWV